MFITPHPGATIDSIRTVLRRVLVGAENANNLHGPSVDRYNGYRAWVNDSVRALHQQIAPAEIDRLLLTRRYWAIESFPGAVGAALNLVQVELMERLTALKETCDQLDDLTNKWSRPGIFVIPERE
jgi:hypothetical protein